VAGVMTFETFTYAKKKILTFYNNINLVTPESVSGTGEKNILTRLSSRHLLNFKGSKKKTIHRIEFLREIEYLS
jgi:hypothetical protein